MECQMITPATIGKTVDVAVGKRFADDGGKMIFGVYGEILRVRESDAANGSGNGHTTVAIITTITTIFTIRDARFSPERRTRELRADDGYRRT